MQPKPSKKQTLSHRSPDMFSIWSVLIDHAQRDPSGTKDSILKLHGIRLFDEFTVDFLIAALNLGGE